jgi:hypothetical protein
MRQRINDNPVLGLALVALLGIAVVFLFLSRMSSSSSTGTAAPAPATTTPATGAAPAATDPAAAAAAPTAPSTGTTPPLSTQATGDFVAGPGLPKAVVQAHEDGKIVVLLVFKRNGIDDRGVRHLYKQLPNPSSVALFKTSAVHVTRYSRIAVGVDLNRVPAIVVVKPTKKHASPTATITYGYIGADSIEQAIRDAGYKGPDDLPSYPTSPSKH